VDRRVPGFDVTLIQVLAVMAVAQSIFLVFLAIAMWVNRSQNRRQMRSAQNAATTVGTPLRQWLLSGGSLDPVVAALGSVPPADAAAVLVRVVATRLSPEHLTQLATALRPQPWVRRALRMSRSVFWWRRVEAARLLAVVGMERDRDRLRRLLDDRSPAVQVVAGAALSRIGGDVAVSAIMERLPERSRFVRVQHFAMLRDHWLTVTPLLRVRLLDERDAKPLLVWVMLADSLQVPELFPLLCRLASYPDRAIREAVAKALRSYFHADAETALLRLLLDTEGRVRAEAARSLGALGALRAVPSLTAAIGDQVWDVRFRAACALAQLGEQGRNALRLARGGSDRYASAMAATVAGLSPGALDEMVAD
jgi:HEAT repeat protein